jgi:uncharacterized membrane protein SpoIIM required for sporulation
MNSRGREIIRILTEARRQIIMSLLLFILAGIAGALYPHIGDAALAGFAEYVQKFLGKSTPDLILSIFLRNASAAGTAIALGVFFGLVPLAAIAFNGILFGAVMRLMPAESWRLLPHGVFELPAMFIAWGLGLWIGLWFMEAPRWRRLKERLAASLRVYLMLILPLLVVAAVIEGLAAHLYRG